MSIKAIAAKLLLTYFNKTQVWVKPLATQQAVFNQLIRDKQMDFAKTII
jgi:hypothetical protein